MLANQDAVSVWQACRNQWIMGMGGPIGINHLAVWRMIDEQQIRHRMQCFKKVCEAASIDIAAISSEKDNKPKP